MNISVCFKQYTLADTSRTSTEKCTLHGRKYIGANAHRKLIITHLHGLLARSMFKKKRKKTKTASKSRYCGYVLMHRRNRRARVIPQKFQTIFDFVWNFKSLQMHIHISLLALQKLGILSQTQNALNKILIIIIQAGECVNI